MRTRRGIAFASLLVALVFTAPPQAGPSQVPGVQVALRAHGLYQGPAAVRRHGLYGETRIFVRSVLALERRM